MADCSIIKAQHLSVQFKLYTDNVRSLKEFVTATINGNIKYEPFWALQDINFSVEKGEVLGIIGGNGAGKSTLLKVISGIIKPTKGSIETQGTVVPMLELGSGFDFDLTGRENIYLNGAILGYTKEFLHSKFEKILDFSELGKFIDVPLRNYSSGMLARLAFSIATIVNPEILIVDEILSVGDEKFQNKSHHRMKQLMSGGTTVLFVSHRIEQIHEICSRVIWLDHGIVKDIGPADEICKKYAL